MVWRATVAQLRYVSPIPPGAARGLVAEVYAQVQREFGMLAPPITLHSPAPPVLAAAWSMLRETMLASGAVSPAAREAAAVAVSLGNACPYCVDVHSTLLYGLAPGADVAALTASRVASITDPEIRAVAAWAKTSGTRTAGAGRRPVIPPEHAPELLGVLLTFHYLNRMVNVFLRPSPFPPGMADRTRRRLGRLVGRLLAGRVRRDEEPGASIRLLPPAALPAGLRWAARRPSLAEALARASAAIEAAGRRSVPEPVRDRVTADLAGWDGRPPGISRAWVEDAVATLPDAHRATGRLALLTAFASYQVDGSIVDEFRRHHPTDTALIEVVSWASLAAARQVVSWAGPNRGPIPPGG
jgi:alkylhydroperoxidase family enzyme